MGALSGDSVQACVLRKSAAQSIASNGFVTLTWDVESEDPGGWHNLVTNTSRITVPGAGWYRVSCMVSWENVTSLGRVVRMVKNGTKLLGGTAFTSTLESYSTPSWEGRLAANDYIEVVVFQTYICCN